MLANQAGPGVNQWQEDAAFVLTAAGLIVAGTVVMTGVGIVVAVPVALGVEAAVLACGGSAGGAAVGGFWAGLVSGVAVGYPCAMVTIDHLAEPTLALNRQLMGCQVDNELADLKRKLGMA